MFVNVQMQLHLSQHAVLNKNRCHSNRCQVHVVETNGDENSSVTFVVMKILFIFILVE